MAERSKRTIEVWDRCECGKVLHSISEGERGMCSSCWMQRMPSDTKDAIKKLVAAAFRPTSEEDKGKLVDSAMEKLKRDEST